MKVFEGVVISNNMTSTVVVEVFRITPHPLYRKLVKLSKKYKVDTGGEKISIGSTVRIIETKPVSKDKYFKIFKVISKGEGKIVVNDEKEIEEVLKKSEKPKVKKTVNKEKKEVKT